MAINTATKTYTFTPGTTILSSEVNQNYDDIITPFNEVVNQVVSSPVDGFAWNYQITTGIGSDDLTISLKGKDGNDPASDNPVHVRLGNNLRSVVGSLALTLDDADGDYFGWDAGKIQGNDAQLFVYLADNSGNVRLCVSPDPSKTTCGSNRFYSSAQQGSAGHTNIVCSGTTASSDPCRVIGRINVKQADDNDWETPTTELTINYPIYETDFLVYTPTLTAEAPMTYTSTSVNLALYKIAIKQMFFIVSATGTTGVSAAVDLQSTVPISFPATYYSGGCRIDDTGLKAGFWTVSGSDPKYIKIFKYDSSNYGLGASKAFYCEGFYTLS